ncbi:cytochrome c family protein [Desulfovibrio sp. OttesenSCG-928-G15]|nr:cytochrome c family protein [Desulfovibrio sp. OttesenSCG-928-G15]
MRYLTAVLVALVFVCVGAAQAKDDKGPGAIKNNPILIEGGESARMSVIFSHKSHRGKGFNCRTCHHESSSNTPYSSCRECHSTPGARERDEMSMFMAFHAKGTDRSCYGCHAKLAEQSPGAYPSFQGCRPCHSTQAREAAAAFKAAQQ